MNRLAMLAGVLVGLLPLCGHAEMRIESLAATRPDLDAATYRFPVVVGDGAVAQRINTWLQAVELHKLPGRYRKTAFEDIWPTEGWQGTTSMDYEVVSNLPGFLSLVVSGEFMGAYPSQGASAYNFETASGFPIRLTDLFSGNGLATFRQRVSEARTRRIDAFLAGQTVPDSRASGTGASDGLRISDDAETAEEQRSIYTDCRDSVAEADMAYDQLRLGRDELTVIRGHCAAHVNQAVDDLWDFENSYPYADLTPLLSDYGRCLLIDRRTDCPARRQGLDRGVLHGRLGGRYPITFVVQRVYDDGSIGAAYFYDSQAKYIELQGQKGADGSYRFTERPESGVEAVFDLHLRPDAGLSGSWTQKGKPSLPVDLD